MVAEKEKFEQQAPELVLVSGEKNQAAEMGRKGVRRAGLRGRPT